MIEEDPSDSEERYVIQVPAATVPGMQRVLKAGDTFAVFDEHGDIPAHGVALHGIYHAGTRFLCGLRLLVDGYPLLLLGSAVREDDVLLVVELTNADHRTETGVIAHGSLHILRMKFLEEGRCQERIEITNFSAEPVRAQLAIAYEADFRDLFEVRGTPRERRGRMIGPLVGDDHVRLGYHGLDDTTRVTWIELSPPPTRVTPRRAMYDLRLEPKESRLRHPPRARPYLNRQIPTAGGARVNGVPSRTDALDPRTPFDPIGHQRVSPVVAARSPLLAGQGDLQNAAAGRCGA